VPTPALEKKFAVLCGIVRAQHFAWREAVRTLCPDVDPATVVDRMWEITGRETAASYLRRIDRSRPLAPQVAECIAASSECMGEDARAEALAGRDEAYVRHADCPWFHWHERLGLLAEDRPGCDRWFQSTVASLNDALGSRLRVETEETLPEGGARCSRRIWSVEAHE
jgi:hypothetical protein